MRFGPTPIREAEGAILAHSLSVGGGRLRKGTRLSADDIARMAADGIADVTVAQLEPGDVPEDEAAALLAEALASPGLRVGHAATGRCNLYAEHTGLVTLDPDAVHQLNLIDEAITLATVMPNARVEEGQIAATIKIIPFAVPQAVLKTTVAQAKSVGLRLAPFKLQTVALIQTRLPGQKPELFTKTERVTEARLTRLGLNIDHRRVVAHETVALAETLRATEADLYLVIGASAITDRGDVIPAAVTQAGGRIERLGMPVDPGNLLCLGEIAGKPVIGLPGCARSPKMNGFDWVLERLAAGLPVTSNTIARMGVGGLIDEIPERPVPRRSTEEPDPHTGEIGAIVLAAGQSRRMGTVNKLLIEVGGKPIVAHVVDTLLTAGIRQPVVVTGSDAQAVEAALASRDVRFVHNPDFAAGLSASIRAGVQAAPSEWHGALICLGDMPEVTPETIMALKTAFDPPSGKTICVPVHEGKRGNPVLWHRSHFARLAALTGDVGGKPLLAEFEAEIAEVPVSTRSILDDVDTPASADALIARWSPA